MKMKTKTNRSGFTLIEMLVVVAIIGILAAILVPLAGGARKATLKRRATLEMNSIKVALLRFYDDHHYMPWGDPANMMTVPKVGDDALTWTGGPGAQENVMKWLTGDNPMAKIYLQIPEKSKKSGTLVFVEPWKNSATGIRMPYKIGLDRNMDGVVTVAGTDVSQWDGKTVSEKVLVCSSLPPGQDEPLKTFDVVEEYP